MKMSGVFFSNLVGFFFAFFYCSCIWFLGWTMKFKCQGGEFCTFDENKYSLVQLNYKTHCSQHFNKYLIFFFIYIAILFPKFDLDTKILHDDAILNFCKKKSWNCNTNNYFHENFVKFKIPCCNFMKYFKNFVKLQQVGNLSNWKRC